MDNYLFFFAGLLVVYRSAMLGCIVGQIGLSVYLRRFCPSRERSRCLATAEHGRDLFYGPWVVVGVAVDGNLPFGGIHGARRFDLIVWCGLQPSLATGGSRARLGSCFSLVDAAAGVGFGEMPVVAMVRRRPDRRFFFSRIIHKLFGLETLGDRQEDLKAGIGRFSGTGSTTHSRLQFAVFC